MYQEHLENSDTVWKDRLTNGIRTAKTVNGVKHSYTLEGSKILRETWGTNSLVTLYDNEENVCGLVYNDEPYYFIKNLQGDVIAITDRSGIVVARYSYDAWGVCTIEQDSAYCIGGINPYRYRGYYYDSEIGMYYLQSRYYDPAVGRFVNADEAMFGTVLAKTVVAHNLFVYCYNTPVKMLDFYGYEGVLIAGVFIVLIVLFAYFSIVRITTNPKVQDIWRNWCKAISDRLNEIWNKVTILFQSAASIVEKAVAKNVEKAKAVLRTKKHQEYYWIASKVTFKVRGKLKQLISPVCQFQKKNAAPYI